MSVAASSSDAQRIVALLLAATLIVSVGRVDGDELGVLSFRGDIVSVGEFLWGQFYGREGTNSVREDTFMRTDAKNTKKCWEWKFIEGAREHALYANSSLLQQCQEGTARQLKKLVEKLARRNATLTSVRTNLSRCHQEYHTTILPELEQLRKMRDRHESAKSELQAELENCTFVNDLYRQVWMPEMEENMTKQLSNAQTCDMQEDPMLICEVWVNKTKVLEHNVTQLRDSEMSNVANNTNLSELLAAANETLTTLRRENALHVENSTKLAEQLAAVNETLTNLTRESASHVENSTKLAEQFAAANETLTTLTHRNAFHVAHIKELENGLLDADKHLRRELGENAELTTKNAAHVAKITALERQLCAANGQHEPKAEVSLPLYVIGVFGTFALVPFTMKTAYEAVFSLDSSFHRFLDWYFIIPDFTSRTAWRVVGLLGFLVMWVLCYLFTTWQYWYEHVFIVVFIDLGALRCNFLTHMTPSIALDSRVDIRESKFLTCFFTYTICVSFCVAFLFIDLTFLYILPLLHGVLYVCAVWWIAPESFGLGE